MFLLIALGLVLMVDAAPAQSNVVQVAPASSQPMVSQSATNYLGLFTNGPAVAELVSVTTTTLITNRFLPPRLATNPAALRVFPSRFTYTNAVFREFQPESLNYVIWTNFMALTNGRDLRIWSERLLPQAWTNRPSVRWNTNSVIWGMKGLTALSACWQVENGSGHVPFTALTRRHAYTRGHGLGPEGFQTVNAGRKVWFFTRGNVLVEAVIKRHVTRVSAGTNGVHRDYTIALFDHDLPETIESMGVATLAEVQSRYPFPRQVNWPQPIFQTEQGGYVSTGVAPLVVNTWKPGDSGSPNLVPLPGELIFFSGRSTSGPSREMQEDMDELCRLEGLNPKKYQLRWADLSRYPAY
jgi:hypothetical protein